MKRVNQYNFYQMGTILHPLSQIAQEASIVQIAWDLSTARSWLNWLLGNSLVTLVVSRAAISSLITSINKIIPQNYDEFSSIDPEKKLSWLEWYEI